MTVGLEDRPALARWAADCAAHILPLFEGSCPGDDRPRRAIGAARAWAGGGTTVEADLAASEADAERAWKALRLPSHLRAVVFADRGERA